MQKELLPEETRKLRLDHGWIMAGKDPAISLGNLALESYYSLGNSSVITAVGFRAGKEKYDCHRMLLC